MTYYLFLLVDRRKKRRARGEGEEREEKRSCELIFSLHFVVMRPVNELEGGDGRETIVKKKKGKEGERGSGRALDVFDPFSCISSSGPVANHFRLLRGRGEIQKREEG